MVTGEGQATLGQGLFMFGSFIPGPIGVGLMITGAVLVMTAPQPEPEVPEQAKVSSAKANYNIRSATPTKTIACGETLITPSYAYINQEGENLYLVLLICNGEINDIKEILFNNEIVYKNSTIKTKWQNNVRLEFRKGVENQLPITWVWDKNIDSSNKRIDSIAYIAFELKRNRDLFKSGVPVVKVLVQGAKTPDITAADPLTSPYVYRNDPISFLLYYLLSKDSPIKDPKEIDLNSFKIAYQAMSITSEVNVDSIGLSIVKYFEFNGSLKLDTSPLNVINVMLELCHGSLTIIDGKYTVSCIGRSTTLPTQPSSQAISVTNEIIDNWSPKFKDNIVFSFTPKTLYKANSSLLFLDVGDDEVSLWAGTRDNGETFRIRAGDSSKAMTGSTNDTVVLDVPVSLFPFDNKEHTIIFDIRINPGRARLWVDNILIGQAHTLNGGSLKNGAWAQKGLRKGVATSWEGFWWHQPSFPYIAPVTVGEATSSYSGGAVSNVFLWSATQEQTDFVGVDFLFEKNIIGDVVYLPFSGGEQRFGKVAGTFSSPDDNHQDVSYPVQVIDDKKPLIQKNWNFVTSIEQAYLLNLLMYHTSINSTSLRIEVDGIQPVVGKLYKVDLPTLQITRATVFVVVEVEVMDDLSYSILLRKYFTRTDLKLVPALVLSRLTEKPTNKPIQLSAPKNLTWYEIRSISNPSAATQSKLKLLWDYEGENIPSHYEIKQGETVISTCFEREYILDWISRGNYKFSVRAVGILTKESDWVTVDVVIDGLPEIPSTPAGLTVQKGLKKSYLSWDASTDPDVLSGGYYLMYFTQKTDGVFHDTSILPGRVPGNSNFFQIDGQKGKYFVQPVNSSKLTGVPAEIVVIEDHFIILSDKQLVVSPDFRGILENLQIDNGKLVPKQSALFKDVGIVYNYKRVIATYTSNLEGKFYPVNTLDTGERKAWTPYFDIDTILTDTDTSDDVTSSQMDYTLYYQASDDSSTFGSWNEATGNYGSPILGRYFKFYIRIKCGQGFTYTVNNLKFGVKQIDV